MKERFKVEMEATLLGFYNPEEESLEQAQDRIVLDAEVAVNSRWADIRMHARRKNDSTPEDDG